MTKKPLSAPKPLHGGKFHHRKERRSAPHPRAVCESCGNPTDPAKYHDCGERLTIFPELARVERNEKARARRKAKP